MKSPSDIRLTTETYPNKQGFVCYFCEKFIAKGDEGHINFYGWDIVHPLHCSSCNTELTKERK